MPTTSTFRPRKRCAARSACAWQASSRRRGRLAERWRQQLNGLGRRVTLVENSWANIQGRVDELSRSAQGYELARREAETVLRERITAVETRLEERERSSERTGS